MRGENWRLGAIMLIARGLIPACAGKTKPHLCELGFNRAHPRMRGENEIREIFERQQVGSSPHARGKPKRRLAICLHDGLIPACAGKTSSIEVTGSCRRAHPRMRGENFSSRNHLCGQSGSSPHARGKLGAWDKRHSRGRLIPACAGKTLAVGLRDLCVGAHPRMRGENVGA